MEMTRGYYWVRWTDARGEIEGEWEVMELEPRDSGLTQIQGVGGTGVFVGRVEEVEGLGKVLRSVEGHSAPEWTGIIVLRVGNRIPEPEGVIEV